MTTPSGPWERRPQPRHAQEPSNLENTRPTRQRRSNPRHAAPGAADGTSTGTGNAGTGNAGTGFDRRNRPQPLPYRAAGVPFFPGEEDATMLIQRITDVAASPESRTTSAAEETMRLADRPLTPRRDDRRDQRQGRRQPAGNRPAGLPPAGVIMAVPPDGGLGTEPTIAGDEQLRTERTGGVVRAGSMMAVATLTSRLTGFISRAILLGALGATAISDSYNVANTLPNIIFELLLGGVLTSVAIPLLSRARSDPDGGTAYTQRLMTLALVGLLATTVVAIAAAPLLTRLYLSSNNTADPALATQLAFMLLPQIFFYGIAALFGAILNTKERFAAPVWAPLVNNLVVIGVGLAVALMPGGLFGTDKTGHLELVKLGSSQLLVLGLGTTLGIAMQALALLPSLRRSGFRFKWRWGWDRRMAEAGGLAGWAIVYVLMSQAGYVILTRVASGKIAGGVTVYSFSSLLFQLPYGILGVSVLTAIMPRMSRHAAIGDVSAVKKDAALANRLSTITLMPIAAAMLALSGPLSGLSSHYGNVSPANVLAVGGTLAGLAVGLVPLAVTLVQMRVFYAMKDGRTPTYINAIMVAVRIPLMLLCTGLRTDLVVPGLAAATTVSYLVGAAVGEAWLRAKFGAMGTSRLLATVAKMAVASGIAGLAAWYVSSVPGVNSLVRLLVGGLVGLIVLVPIMLLTRMPEVDPLRRRLATLLGFREPKMAPSKVHSSTARPPISHSQEFRPVASDKPDLPDNGAADAAAAGAADVGAAVSGAAGQHAAPPRPGRAPDQPTIAVDQPTVTVDQPTVTVPTDPPTVTAGQPTVTAGASSAEAAPTLAPGASVGGRYRLVNQVAIDSGGNRFWRAKDTVLPRDMAITLMPDSSGTSATVARTLRAGRLHHIGLPQTLDLGTDHGQTFVVGQWVDGATLTDLMARGPLEPGVATSIAGKISEAVAEAHRNGLALGSINPSLVRVNVDGQVRFSHVIAHASATPDADIRAVGALLYLMLTGTWPSSEHVPELPGTSIKAAPSRNGREVPAAELNPQVPVPLSDLAGRALHPDDPDGIHAVGALSTLLRDPDVAPTQGAPGSPEAAAAAAPPPPATMSPADRKLRQERRVKLGIATAFLAAFVAMILIIVASLAKNTLTSINTYNISNLGPVSTSVSQKATPTTVSQSTVTSPSTPGSGGSANGTTAATTSGAAAAVVPQQIIQGAVYDPDHHSGSKDYEDLVDRLWDGDPTTAWLTFAYKQQFGPNAYKRGVGVVLQFAKPVTPQSVTITAVTPGVGIEVRTATSLQQGGLETTQVLGSGQIGSGPGTIQLSNAPSSQFLLVFITSMPPTDSGQFQAKLGEIVVNGS
ncbi:MAG: murein biosynthesis integral membrane protein MurJ [Actinomycetota bacterium]|nr:murein biosynthesis integral membrane protein MurJ [Actinomycetota bacterium]